MNHWPPPLSFVLGQTAYMHPKDIDPIHSPLLAPKSIWDLEPLFESVLRFTWFMPHMHDLGLETLQSDPIAKLPKSFVNLPLPKPFVYLEYLVYPEYYMY